MSAEPLAPARKSIRVGVVTPIVRLDPYDLQDYTTGVVAMQVFQAPFEQADVHGPVISRVLEAPETMPGDARTMLARLRPGLCFSDGSALTTLDVVHSLRRSPKLGPVQRIEAVAKGVEFHLSQPAPRLDLTLSKRWCAITRATDEGGYLGTGPYCVDPSSTPEHLTLRRNPHADPAPALDEVEFVTYPADESGRFNALAAALESGEVDFTFVLGRDASASLSGVRKLFQPGSSTLFLFMNTQRSPLDNADARRALATGLDRYALAGTTYENPAGFMATSALPPRFSKFRDGITHDPQGAKEKLASLAFPDRPLRTVMIWGPRPYVPNPAALAKELAHEFSELGVQLDIVQPPDAATYFETLRSGEYDLVVGGWIADTSDPADFLESILGSECIPVVDRSRAATSNISRWANPQTDALIASLRRTRDPSSVQALLEQVRDEVPLLPLSYGPTCVVHQWRIRGFELDPLGLPRFADIDVD